MELDQVGLQRSLPLNLGTWIWVHNLTSTLIAQSIADSINAKVETRTRHVVHNGGNWPRR